MEAMARGGIYDQLAGGFARYSVDSRWIVPHFEKMLYDNALLLGVYAHWWRLTGYPLAERVVEETVEWLLRRDAHRPRAASPPVWTPTPWTPTAYCAKGPSTPGPRTS